MPRAQVWLTETGGLVRRDNGSTTEIPEGPRHAGEVTRYIFDRIVPQNPRISRVYIYHWNAAPPSDVVGLGAHHAGRARAQRAVRARPRAALRPAARARLPLAGCA